MAEIESCHHGLSLADAEPQSSPKASPKRDVDDSKQEPAPKSQPKRRKKGTQDAGDAMKKCKRCKQQRASSEFFQGHGHCQECSLTMRNLQNIAKKSGEVEWLRSLEDSEVDKLMQAYNKEKSRAQKERTKVKFNLAMYKERSYQSNGVRKENRRRMMTAEQYYMFAKTVDGGALSQTQAQQKWQDFLQDSSVPQEGEGKNFKLGVPLYMDIVDYDDAGTSREIERQAKLNAKMNAQDHASKVKDLVLTGDREIGRAGARASVLQDAGESVHKLQDIPTQAKKKQKTESETHDGEGGDEELEEESKHDDKETKWFDACAEQAKAARKFGNDLNKAGLRLKTMQGNMMEALDAARAATTTTGKSAVTEMKILDGRLKALTLVYAHSAEDLANHFKELIGRDGADAKSVNTNGSANEQALAMAGPCHNFQSLMTVQEANGFKAEFQSVTSSQSLDTTWKRAKAVFNHWDELLAACRTAVAELKKAVDGMSGDVVRAKAKAKGKAKAKAKAKNSKMYQIFETSEIEEVKTYDTYPIPESHDMSKPFILTGLPEMFQKLLAGEVDGDGNETVRAVKKDLDGFEEVFRKSDLRFTAGKGQRRLEGAGAKVAESMLSVLAKHTVLEVEKWQPPSCFASIEKHRSLQYEAGGFGSLRLTTKGERAVIVASPQKVVSLLETRNNKKKEDERDRVTFASIPPFLSSAEDVDFQELRGTIYSASLSKGMIFYTPAGMVSGEAVKDMDHVGLKVSVVVVGPDDGDKDGIASLRSMQMESKEAGKKSEALDGLLTAVDNKISELKAAAATATANGS